jgi:glucokinase
MSYIGIDLGGTKILGALFDDKGTVLYKNKKKTKAKNGIKTVEEQLFSLIDDLLKKSEKDTVKAIGIGVPGLVDIKTGTVKFAPNIAMDNYPIGNLIKEKYGIDVFVGNDVNVGTLGEWKYSLEGKASNFIGIFIGTGIGGGIIIDNKLYTGSGGVAGELGHMSVDSNGAICGCGSRGCLEAVASKTGIQNEIRARIKRGETTDIKESLEKEGILKSGPLKEAYDKNDKVVKESVDRAAEYLGVGIANLINIFDPEAIVFGGGVIEELGDVILPIVKEKASRYAMRSIFENVKFEKAKLGDDAGIMGAFVLAQEGVK